MNDESNENTETIFVSIASYRDKICTTTLSNLYKQATFPERVYVGICQQNVDDDSDCVLEAQVPENLASNVSWCHCISDNGLHICHGGTFQNNT